jgi:hypothetical protein
MKKFVAIGLLAALATISLNGCMTPPVEEVETEVTPDVQVELAPDPVAEEVEMAVFKNDEMGIQFEYPKSMHIEIVKPIPTNALIQASIKTVLLGKEYHENGALLPIYEFSFERADFQELLVNEDLSGGPAPFKQLSNHCEDENYTDAIWNCAQETEDAPISFFGILGQDFSFEKFYYIEKPNEDWGKMQISVDLWTDELTEIINSPEVTNYIEILQELPLDESQLEQIKTVETIIDSIEYL